MAEPERATLLQVEGLARHFDVSPPLLSAWSSGAAGSC
jgi:hypothetical protein